MSNIYFDISHIGENCGLCGLPNHRVRSSFHGECRWRLDNLRALMKRKSAGEDEAAVRYQLMQEHADWLLKRLSSRELRARIGETGQDAVMLFDMRRRDV